MDFLSFSCSDGAWFLEFVSTCILVGLLFMINKTVEFVCGWLLSHLEEQFLKVSLLELGLP